MPEMLLIFICVAVSDTNGGLTIVPNDAEDGWSYDADRESVVFSGAYEPPSGALVKVRYRVVTAQRCQNQAH